MVQDISVKTDRRTEFVNITPQVQDIIDKSGIKSGMCTVYVPHTTAGVTINEGADPSVVTDILSTLNQLVPQNPAYKHMEGNSDSHIKSSIVGPFQTIIIEKGRLLLGTWQAIFFCEFDGPRSRKVTVKLMSD